MENRLTKTETFWVMAFAVYMAAIAGLTIMQILPDPLPAWADKVAAGIYACQIHLFGWGLVLVCLLALPMGIIAFLINLNRQG